MMVVDGQFKTHTSKMPSESFPMEVDLLSSSPTLLEGNPKDIRFAVHDLGISTLISFDEAGDVAYFSHGDEPNTVAIQDQDGFSRQSLVVRKGQTLLKRFGKQSELLAPYSRLLPGGSVFTHNPTMTGEALLNGKPILQNFASSTMFPSPLDRGQQALQSEDGIYFMNPFPNPATKKNHQLQFVDWSGKVSNLDFPSPFIQFVGSSTQMGAVAIMPGSSKGRSQIYRFSKEHSSIYSLDVRLNELNCFVCRDSIYLTSTRNLGPQEYPLKLVGRDFIKQALPSKAYSARVIAAGSAKSCILNVAFKTKSSFSLKTYYVDENRCFEFEKILQSIGLDNLRQIGGSTILAMDSRGDVIVSGSKGSFQRLYLLERRP